MALHVLSNLKAADSLPHLAPDKAQLLLFAGRRGMGKTTALLRYVETQEPRVLALDAFNDFGGIRLVPPRMPVVQDDDAIIYPDIDRALDEMYEPVGALKYPACRRRLRPSFQTSDDAYDSRTYAESLFRQLTEGHVKNFLLVLDEISLWSTPKATKALTTIVMQGRRMGIRMAVGTQRIGLVPDVILSEATGMLLFRQTRPRDRDVIEEWAGEEIAQNVPNLRVGECIRVDL